MLGKVFVSSLGRKAGCKYLLRFMFGILLGVAIGACSGNALPNSAMGNSSESDNVAEVTMVPYVFRTSEPGYASAHGRLIVMSPQVILPKPDGIYLVSVDSIIEDPSAIPSVGQNSEVQADVDERTGEFVFTNLVPGRYMLVVLTTNDTQIPAKDIDTGSYAVLEVIEADIGATVEIGDVRVP